MIIPVDWMEDNTIYNPQDIDMICDKVKYISTYTDEGKIKYLNLPVAFDTETTSFIDKDGNKTAIVYIWMLSIAGLTIVGRSMDEWIQTYKRLVYNFRTCGKRILIIYVHNLSFDFQFIRKYHEFEKVFAMGKYDPLYATTIEGIQFRCSYKLSGYSLQKVGENLHFHKVRKLKGDLDYRQLRHTQTELSPLEMQYCINDVKVVCAYIDELIDREGAINKLPLTKTGFVRTYCRGECFKDRNYRYYVKSMQLTPQDFELCKAGFQGGYTHSNPEKTDMVCDNVTSLDIISSYPSVMVAEKYPIESPKHITIESYSQFKYYNENFCTIFRIEFINIRPRHWFDFYISASKCIIHGKRIIANGRIVSADSIVTTITNVDFDIIDYMYQYDDIYIQEFIYFKRDYLPTPFIKSLLAQYQKKTELKGVEGKEMEYAVSKENQNSFYGMTVTSPIRPEFIYDIEWKDPIEPELNKAMQSYNNNHNRFLFYPWGVFVTAYARYNIWSALIECGHDHIYTDTDSEKCVNFSTHAEWFRMYNETVANKLKFACKIHGIDFNMCNPKTIKGQHKLLGAFEIDGVYDKFKTLGAKRYLYKHGDEYGLVVAGLNKKLGLEYLLKTYGDDIFNGFTNGLIVPSQYSGRLIHTYIDEIRKGKITDLNGVTADYSSLSGIHLDPAPYSLSVPGEYVRFITNIKEGEYIGNN